MELIIFVLMLVVAFFGSAIIAGVRQYRQEQKPPKELRSYKEIYDWYNKQGKDISPEADGQSGQNELQHEVLNYIDSCLKSGKKIEAIKIYKENYGCNLAEVKRAIEKKYALLNFMRNMKMVGKNNCDNGEDLVLVQRIMTKKKYQMFPKLMGWTGMNLNIFAQNYLVKMVFLK